MSIAEIVILTGVLLASLAWLGRYLWRALGLGGKAPVCSSLCSARDAGGCSACPGSSGPPARYPDISAGNEGGLLRK